MYRQHLEQLFWYFPHQGLQELQLTVPTEKVSATKLGYPYPGVYNSYSIVIPDQRIQVHLFYFCGESQKTWKPYNDLHEFFFIYPRLPSGSVNYLIAF